MYDYKEDIQHTTDIIYQDVAPGRKCSTDIHVSTCPIKSERRHNNYKCPVSSAVYFNYMEHASTDQYMNAFLPAVYNAVHMLPCAISVNTLEVALLESTTLW